MRMMAAAVGAAHTFEVVTQIEWAAVIGLWHWRSCCLLRLFHGLPTSEPQSDLEVGQWCWILYRHL